MAMAELIGLLSWPQGKPVDPTTFSAFLLQRCQEVTKLPTYFVSRLPAIDLTDDSFKQSKLSPGYIPENCSAADFIESQWEENCVLFCPMDEFAAVKGRQHLALDSVLVLRSQGVWQQYKYSDFVGGAESDKKVYIDLKKISPQPPFNRIYSGELPVVQMPREKPPGPVEERKDGPPPNPNPEEPRSTRAFSTNLQPVVIPQSPPFSPVSTILQRNAAPVSPPFSPASATAQPNPAPALPSYNPAPAIPQWNAALVSPALNPAPAIPQWNAAPVSPALSPASTIAQPNPALPSFNPAPPISRQLSMKLPDSEIMRKAKDHQSRVEQRVQKLAEELKNQLSSIGIANVQSEALEPRQLGAFISDCIQRIIQEKEQEIRASCFQAISAAQPVAQQCAGSLAKIESDYQSLVAAITQQMNEYAGTLAQMPQYLGSGAIAPQLQELSSLLDTVQNGIYYIDSIIKNELTSERPLLKVLTAFTVCGPVLLIRWKTWKPGDVKLVHFYLSESDVVINPQWVFLSSELEVVPFAVSQPASLLIIEGDEHVLIKSPVAVTNEQQEVPLEWDVRRFGYEQQAILEYYQSHGQNITSQQIEEIKAKVEDNPVPIPHQSPPQYPY